MNANWTEAQVQRLCVLVREIPTSVSDVERWKTVSRKLGTHSKGECYRKYQEVLRAAESAELEETKSSKNSEPQPSQQPQQQPLLRPSSQTESHKPRRSLSHSSVEIRGRFPLAEESAFLTSILSDGKRVLPKSWTQQGITFRQDPGFRWAIRQWEGGPCGPLAVIQAFVVSYLIRECGARWREPSNEQQRRCLLQVMVDVLLRCANPAAEAIPICALPEGGTILGGNLSARQLFHSMIVHEIPVQLGREYLVEQLSRQYDSYTSARGPGLLLFLSSVLLTKSENAVKADMVFGLHMIDRHGYSGQELVNLLIAGQATPCVYDELETSDESVIDEGAIVTEQGRLCGIKMRCDVGFLTAFEFFGHVSVGEHLKRPVAEIWVICMESHYSTAFRIPNDRDPELETSMRSFDLGYYDQLEKAAELIVLTLSSRTDFRAKSLDPVHAPPLELVLHTRWPTHSVDWNGTEPLL